MRRLLTSTLFCLSMLTASAQELNCKVTINHSKVQSTSQVFSTLETALNSFMNDRHWTAMQFGQNERINCNMQITVKKYDDASNEFTCEMLMQSSRPVYNSSYNTTVFSFKDANFNFTYQEYDQLEWRDDQLESNLTAMLAYYAYLIIGMDLATFSPKGGTEILEKAENVVTQAQGLGEKGWKAFDDSRNRHAIINDYLDVSLEPLRQMQYKYYREGLDAMASNVDIGRAAISESIELLGKANENKPLSLLPQILTDVKKDEYVSIYKGHGTQQEKERIYDILTRINASQSSVWESIKK